MLQHSKAESLPNYRLIAILLGRLCLGISEATTVFTIIAQKVFTERTGEGQRGNIQGKYSSETLHNVIIEVFGDLQLDPRRLLLWQDAQLRLCNVYGHSLECYGCLLNTDLATVLSLRQVAKNLVPSR